MSANTVSSEGFIAPRDASYTSVETSEIVNVGPTKVVCEKAVRLGLSYQASNEIDTPTKKKFKWQLINRERDSLFTLPEGSMPKKLVVVTKKVDRSELEKVNFEFVLCLDVAKGGTSEKVSSRLQTLTENISFNRATLSKFGRKEIDIGNVLRRAYTTKEDEEGATTLSSEILEYKDSLSNEDETKKEDFVLSDEEFVSYGTPVDLNVCLMMVNGKFPEKYVDIFVTYE